MKSLYVPPWDRPESYEPENEVEEPLYHWRGMKNLLALIVGSLLCLGIGVVIVL